MSALLVVVIDRDALQAALVVIGKEVSAQDPLPDTHPLARAEYALDSALLAYEQDVEDDAPQAPEHGACACGAPLVDAGRGPLYCSALDNGEIHPAT